VVIWVDYTASAYEQSALNNEENVQLQGIHDDPTAEDYQPPSKRLEFVRAVLQDSARRLDAVVLNEKHWDFASNIASHCQVVGRPPPRLVVVTRQVVPQLEGWEWVKAPYSITTKWTLATGLCLGAIADAASRGL